ncbi:MAG: HEPN domain-containing protein [Chloroflexota bacterium]
MMDRASLYLAKALESVAGAQDEFASARYNNSANRSYYACFQAAIAALYRAQVLPPGGGDEWSHSFVAAQFDGMLINRRKLYSSDLRNVLARNHLVRLRADYEDDPVSQTEASRALRRTLAFISAIQAREEFSP